MQCIRVIWHIHLGDAIIKTCNIQIFIFISDISKLLVFFMSRDMTAEVSLLSQASSTSSSVDVNIKMSALIYCKNYRIEGRVFLLPGDFLYS